MSEFIVSLPSDPGLLEAMRQEVHDLPDVTFVEWDLQGPAPVNAMDIVVPPYWGGARRLKNLEQVTARLVQWQSIGYNGVAQSLPEGMPFANASTVHEASTAELAIGLALAAQRGIDVFAQQAAEHSWSLRSYPSLADRRVLIVGYGGVSKAIEARLAGFEVEITRVARSARQDRSLTGEAVAVHGMDELMELLPNAEIVILAVPLTTETTSLLGAEQLAALPDGALIVNVARGPVVNTDALMAELNSGRLRAALDVTDPEPLPVEHPLWDCPNVLITPHAGGDSSAMMPRMTALIRRQIVRLLAGETPENLVQVA